MLNMKILAELKCFDIFKRPCVVFNKIKYKRVLQIIPGKQPVNLTNFIRFYMEHNQLSKLISLVEY